MLCSVHSPWLWRKYAIEGKKVKERVLVLLA